jgi:hypothetical protein
MVAIRYSFLGDLWEKDDLRLNTARQEAAAIKIQNNTKWWITGGTDSKVLITTEILSLDNITRFEIGPDLPETNFGHCIAPINESHVFLAGGISNNSYIIDTYSFNYTILPALNAQRYQPACAVVQHLNKTALMVVGGVCSHGSFFDKFCPWQSEFLPLYDDGNPSLSWVLTLSESLPGGWSDGSYVTDYDGTELILMGSSYNPSDVLPNEDLSRKVISFRNDSFEDLQSTLQYGRSSSTSVSVPKGSIECE